MRFGRWCSVTSVWSSRSRCACSVAAPRPRTSRSRRSSTRSTRWIDFAARVAPHAFSTWLVRIAVNRAKDVLKSKRWSEESLDREVGGGEASFAHEPPTPEAHALRGEQVRRLERALQRVPIKYREVLILKDVEELPYDEIHAILRLPITTLKIRVVRGRVMMQKALDQLDKEGRR